MVKSVKFALLVALGVCKGESDVSSSVEHMGGLLKNMGAIVNFISDRSLESMGFSKGNPQMIPGLTDSGTQLVSALFCGGRAECEDGP